MVNDVLITDEGNHSIVTIKVINNHKIYKGVLRVWT